MTISNDSRDRVKRTFEPIALAMGRAGLTPDALTLIGFAITVVGAILLGGQLWLVGGIVVFVGGVFDMFDGTLARATGQASPVGAFMDSVFDRWGEAIVYVGIAVGAALAGFDLGAILAAAAMASAFMVSYARSKSEGLGFTAGTGMAAVGLAPREIRLVILSIGLVSAGTAGVGPTADGGSLILAATLGLIAILATITVIQRIIHVRRQAAGGLAQPDR
ncbi:MAG TPA: CDP-alcohol phosphatidyltransferase family protein [Candidatus Limnocylindrales bacterium]|nr:CDP-alcohol phosphatidyltransferase family protein [Candidatus Limnocylindrales bacterium]